MNRFHQAIVVSALAVVAAAPSARAQPCPTITTQPASTTVCSATGSAPFSVVATGGEPLFYQWQLEVAPGVWSGMGNDPFPLPCGGGGGGAFAYAAPISSPNVTIGIHACAGVTRYQIRCIVTGSCGSVTSSEATYSICPFDFDCNHSIQPADIAAFVNAWFGSLQGGGLQGDWDHNGTVEPADIAAFVNGWFGALGGGC